MELEDLERAAGLDPDSPDSRLRQALAEADDELIERLVQMRIDKGLTQKQVAERMRRDKAAVSNFERLSADPHLSTIRRYAAAIGACITHDVRNVEAIKPAHYAVYAEDLVSDCMNRWQSVSLPPPVLSPMRVNVTWADPHVEGSNVISLASHRNKRKALDREPSGGTSADASQYG